MSPDELVIRKVRKGDKRILSEIASQSFNRIYRYFAVRSLESERRILVAELGDHPVGFAVLRSIGLHGSKIGYIYWIAIHPDHRGKGIATSLLDASIAKFKEEGMITIYASIEDYNCASRELFQKKGFIDLKRKDIWKMYGIRTIAFYFKLLIAPHEIIYQKKLD